MKNKWTHEGLMRDLADTKGTIYMEVPLGSVWAGQLSCNPGTQRADVIDFNKSYTKFCVNIYEIKVSRADFLSDIRTKKWRGYLNFCDRFYFATPSNLINKKEVPDEAGLYVRGEKGWTCIKAAQKAPPDFVIPIDMLMSMLFMRQRQTRRERFMDNLRWNGYGRSHQIPDRVMLKKLGKKIAYVMARAAEYESQCENARWYTEWMRERFKELENSKAQGRLL